jgi:hypothetical protein
MGDLFLAQAADSNAVVEPELALERLASLFYDKRKEEAMAAASRVLMENEYYSGLQITPDVFIDFVVFCGYQNLINGRNIPVTEQEKRLMADIQKFVEYFKQETLASEYQRDRGISWPTISYSPSLVQ